MFKTDFELIFKTVLVALFFTIVACDEDSTQSNSDAGVDAVEGGTDTADTEDEPWVDQYPDIDPLIVGDSMFVVCLGLNRDYSDRFGDTHDIYVYESADQATNFRLIKESNIEKAPYSVLNYTLVDPTNAPEGHNIICIGEIVMFDWEDYWHWNEDYAAYEAFRFNMAMTLIERAEVDLGESGEPLDFMSHIEVLELITPRTMQGFSLNPHGSVFGWSMIPEQSIANRMPQQTPIDNLLLAGAWTYPGGGQSSSIISGILAGIKIVQKEGREIEVSVKPVPEPRGMHTDWCRKLGILDQLKIICSEDIHRSIYTDSGDEFDASSNPEEYRRFLKDKYPDEAEGIDKLFQTLYDIDKVMRIVFRYTYSGKDPFEDTEAMSEMLAEVMEIGLQDVLMVDLMAVMEGITLTEFMKDYITNEELIAVFTQLSAMAGEGPDNVDAIFFIAMWIEYHLGGFCYVEGGSQEISDVLAERIVESGSTIRLNTLATKIDIDENGLATQVRTADGTCYKGDYIISNVNAPDTFLKMIGEEHLPKITDPEDPNHLFHPGKIMQEKLEPTPSSPVSEPQDNGVDRITGATPETSSALLSQTTHPTGWAQADCMSCHDALGNAHVSTTLGITNVGHYTDAQCTTCHGTNGSTLISAAAHESVDKVNDNCASCHGDVHAGLDYSSPDDCRACHKYNTDNTQVGDTTECLITETYDIVIIGAGAGGLGAGAYLSQEGYTVVALERHHKVGGYMTNFNRGDYRFEVSTHGFDGLGPEPLVDWNVED